MAFFKKWRDALDRDREWIIVHTHDTGLLIGTTDSEAKGADGYLHYALYEDKTGVRRVEISFTGIKLASLLIRDPNSPQTHADVDEFYVVKVGPWLKGLRVKGIDSYAHACQQLSVDELTGDDDASC